MDFRDTLYIQRGLRYRAVLDLEPSKPVIKLIQYRIGKVYSGGGGAYPPIFGNFKDLTEQLYFHCNSHLLIFATKIEGCTQ